MFEPTLDLEECNIIATALAEHFANYAKERSETLSDSQMKYLDTVAELVALFTHPLS